MQQWTCALKVYIQRKSTYLVISFFKFYLFQTWKKKDYYASMHQCTDKNINENNEIIKSPDRPNRKDIDAKSHIHQSEKQWEEAQLLWSHPFFWTHVPLESF